MKLSIDWPYRLDLVSFQIVNLVLDWWPFSEDYNRGLAVLSTAMNSIYLKLATLNASCGVRPRGCHTDTRIGLEDMGAKFRICFCIANERRIWRRRKRTFPSIGPACSVVYARGAKFRICVERWHSRCSATVLWRFEHIAAGEVWKDFFGGCISFRLKLVLHVGAFC